VGRNRLVVIRHQLVDRRAARLHPVLRYVDFRDPDGRVEDGFAEVVLGPVPVDVAAGAAEAAGAVGVLADPHDVLDLVLADALADLGIAAVRVVLALAGAVGGDGGEDGGDALHPFAEAHVVVPLVIGRERPHAVG